MAVLAYLPRVLRLGWNAARNWTLAWFVLLTVQGFLPIAMVYLTRGLVNRVVVLTPMNVHAPLLFAALYEAVLLRIKCMGA